jgi:hypothetical protein
MVGLAIFQASFFIRGFPTPEFSIKCDFLVATEATCRVAVPVESNKKEDCFESLTLGFPRTACDCARNWAYGWIGPIA